MNEPICSNCGLRIFEWKYSNIDHIKSRGSRPDLAHDTNNLRVLCDDFDVQKALNLGYIERSSVNNTKLLTGCHTLRHGNPKAFEEKEGLFRA
jgi:5-methylcytosine-specific restriction endonuclease McrA